MAELLADEETVDDDFTFTLEVVCRLLPLNSANEVRAMRDVLEKIITNIKIDPANLKFRTLKLQNKTLRTKLFDLNGAKEVMFILGFRRKVSDDTKEASMILPLDIKSTEVSILMNEMIETLLESWSWLETQLNICLEMKGAIKSTTSCCAECLLQIRLPNGYILKGGFFADEPLKTVNEFIQAFRPLSNSEDQWILSQTHPNITFSEEEYLNKSLNDLKLTPRASLIAHVSYSTNQLKEISQTEALTKAHNDDILARKQRETNLRQSKIIDAEAVKQERRRVLKQFEDDRANARERRLFAASLVTQTKSDTTPTTISATNSAQENRDRDVDVSTSIQEGSIQGQGSN